MKNRIGLPDIVLLAFAIGTVNNVSAQGATRQIITTEADLPRFSYPVEGDVQHLLDLPAGGFAKFASAVQADIDRTLRDDDVQDHAAHRKLLQARLNIQLLSGADAAALDTIAQIRALEDKPARKLTSALSQEAIARARLAGAGLAHAESASGACPAGYQAAYARSVQALPWGVVGETMKQLQSFSGLMSKPFFAGIAESMLAPVVAKEHALSLDGAETVLDARAGIEFAVPCRPQTEDVLSAYVKTHDVAKADIWPEREAVLPPADKLTPVAVGIWDSGFDTSLFPGRLFTDAAAEPADRHGIAFDVYCHRTHGELIPLGPEETPKYPQSVALMQAIGDMQGGLDTPETKAFKQRIAAMTPTQMRSFYDEMGVLEGHAHGTHVAGIAARGNPAVRLAYVRMTYDNGNPRMPPTEELQKALVASYAESVRWFREHHVRVVNMSWWNTPASYEKDLADNGIGKDGEERNKLARHYFEIERDGLYAALKSAPEILFVTIAGNNNADNAFQEVIPSSFRLPNLIVAGAVDRAGDETGFTSYGDNVAVDANGQAVESVVPGGATVKMSGTSMAAPQVTNLAAKLLAIKPGLTPQELIDLIRSGADASGDGRRHLLNPRRTVDLLQSKSRS